MKYDIDYVDNVTFLNDLKIIFLTVKKVFMRDGIVGAEEQGNFYDYRKKQWDEGIVPKPNDM